MNKKEKVIITTGIIGAGLFLLYKNYSSASTPSGEGQIGGNDLFNDTPNLTTSQVTPTDIDSISLPDFVEPEPESVLEAQETPSVLEGSSVFSPSLTTQTTEPTLSDQGEDLLTPKNIALGGLSFLPTVSTKFGENIGKAIKNADTIKVPKIGDTLKEVPVVGKPLAEFVEPSKVVGEDVIQKAGITVGDDLAVEAAQAAGKGFLKTAGQKVAKYGVSAIPFAGIVAGSEFDVAVDNRPRWLAYPTNVLGDVVGGILGVVTAPAAVTGVGAAVPVAASIAGQVAVSEGVYGLYDYLNPKAEIASANQTVRASSQKIQNEQVKESLQSSRFISTPSGGVLDTVANQSITSVEASNRALTPKLYATAQPEKKNVNTSFTSLISTINAKTAKYNRSVKKSKKSGYAKQGAGYSDYNKLQSITAEEKAFRESNPFAKAKNRNQSRERGKTYATSPFTGNTFAVN